MTALPSETLGDPDLIAALLRIHPKGLGGVWLRARHGPAREALVRPFAALPYPPVRITRNMDDLALFGGLDLNATLTGGAPVLRDGLLTGERTVRLIGAEAMETPMQARIAEAVDGTATLILLDEGAEDEPLPHGCLRDRCAFFLDESLADFGPTNAPTGTADLDGITPSDDDIAALTTTALRAGITGMRPLLFAVETLRALLALDRCETATARHLATAARLVFGHRALPLPEADAPPEDTQPERDDSTDPGDRKTDDTISLPHEMMIEAVRTALPGDILAGLLSRNQTASGAGKGQDRQSSQKGRPLPSRPGKLGGKARPDILATLHAAAPWQRMRGAERPRIAIRPEDIRIRRYKDTAERLIIFAVDASGSAALARMAEGKGAVETLLSRAYSERDFVSMITFRDMGADVALPPTRALARAKNALSGLAAGGATPLPAGLQLALETALQAKRKGQTPHIVLISDGRANRALDGTGDRATAMDEASTLARHLRANGIATTLLDTGRRPSRELAALAEILGTQVTQMPRRMDARAGEALATAISTEH